ncbi:hypothetical protein BMS3Bbin06_01644 [bacterium BMS3Bbin06]|nr:hypothetical protein BMS3Bbin06_01644 [bacterium BMS3Bbin06]
MLPVFDYKYNTLRSLPQFHISVIPYFRHSGLSGIFLPGSMLNKSKDSRQAGMTPKIKIQVSDTPRSLPQFHASVIPYFRHSGLSGIFLPGSMLNKSKDSRQTGMTPKIKIQVSDTPRSLPQGGSLALYCHPLHLLKTALIPPKTGFAFQP